MKRILLLLAILALLAGPVWSTNQKPSNANCGSPRRLRTLLQDWFEGFDDTWFLFSPTDSAPTAAEGKVYYNDTANVLYLCTDGSTWTAIDVGSGTSLDNAYDLGNKIDVDGTVLELEVDDGSNNSALYIDHDEATNDNTAVLIENAADAANAITIDIDAQTTGRDIEGTGASWYVDGSGGATFVAGTFSGDVQVTGSNYNINFDVSRDQLSFADNAVLGIGGADNAAGDVTFKWDATNLLVEAAADNTGQIRIGSTNAIDTAIYGSTNTNIVLFDVSAATVESNGWTWVVQDDDNLNFGDSDEFQIEYDEDNTDNLIIVASTANDAVQIGDGTTGTDLILQSSGDASAQVQFDASGDTNNGQMLFGADDHGIDAIFYGATASQQVNWDQSADTWSFGADAEGVDVYFYADTTGDYFLFDESDEALEGVGVQLHLDDDSQLQLGSTAGDVYLQFNGTNFLIDASTADEGMLIGDTTTGFDVTYAFETAGSFRTDYDGDFVNLTDDMELRFGTGASSDGDFKISSNSSNVLQIEQVVADTGTITVGADGAGIDVTFYGEEAGDYMKWDGTSASKLILQGADSSGTLLGIAGIDTTGNSDTMTIAHSGTGDGLQITCSEADSVALNLVGAASQTTSILKVDGATGTWLGATGVGMVNLTNDGTPAHANASLLRIAQSGTNASGQRGICTSLEDSSTSGGGTEYVLYISSTNNEAIHVDSGAVLVDETITATGGVQSAAYTATATADGLTTGLIPSGTRFCTVTSDSADKVVVLPAAVIGNIITITVPATGAELETLATSNATINGVDCDGTNQMAMTAASVYQLTCVAANTWIAYGWGSNGAAQATIVPDAD